MKRIFSMFLAMMLFFSMTVTAAAESFQISADKDVIEAGEEVTVTVRLNDTLTGNYRNVQGQLKYDVDILSYVSHEMGEKYGHYSAKYLQNKKFFTFSNVDLTSGGFSEIPKGTIVSIVFKTNKDITEKNLSTKFVLNMSVQDIDGSSDKSETDASIVICRKHMIHSWKANHELDEQATMNEDGSRSIHCTECDAKKDIQVIPKAAAVQLTADQYTYSSKAASPEVIVKDVNGNVISSENYTVTIPDGRKNVGNYTYLVTFKNDYEGTKELTLTIDPAKLTSAALSYSAYTYNGKAKTPTVTVKAGTLTAASKRTTDSTNVDLTYAKGRKNVGSYKVTVKGRGNYTGTVTKTFKINPKGTSISKLTKGKKSFTVKWKKQSGKMATSRITGYQYRYSTSSKMTNAKIKTVKGYSKISAKRTGLKAKKKYYVQVRTYKKVGSTTYYSTWSKVKSVKTK
ncbi:MAG: fibronectin type III domain-containing protein [Bacillota bacterium]|nr:fibronectin type III domain-containing protein [Bacillota bacterium]